MLYVLNVGRNASLANFNADGDVLGAANDIDDYINDDSSMELPSALFDPSTPTYLSEDDSDNPFTRKDFDPSLTALIHWFRIKAELELA